MTIRLLYVLFLIFFIVLMGELTMSGQGKPIPGIQGLVIDEKDLPSFEQKALDGNPESARRLSSFYDMVRNDRKQAVYWAMIAAENGSVVGQYNLGFLLRDDPDPKNRRRALYWLKRVSKSGDQHAADMAIQLLKEISEKRAD